jgi:hypothetical protein
MMQQMLFMTGFFSPDGSVLAGTRFGAGAEPGAWRSNGIQFNTNSFVYPAGRSDATAPSFGTGGADFPWRIVGDPSAYDVRLIITGGTSGLAAFNTAAGSSAHNTWYNLASSRAFWSYYTGGSTTLLTCTGTIDIRDATSLSILSSGTFSFSMRAGL